MALGVGRRWWYRMVAVRYVGAEEGFVRWDFVNDGGQWSTLVVNKHAALGGFWCETRERWMLRKQCCKLRTRQDGAVEVTPQQPVLRLLRDTHIIDWMPVLLATVLSCTVCLLTIIARVSPRHVASKVRFPARILAP